MKKIETLTNDTETFTNNAEENIRAAETIRIEMSGEDAFWLLYAAEKSPEIREILEAASRRKALSQRNVGSNQTVG